MGFGLVGVAMSNRNMFLTVASKGCTLSNPTGTKEGAVSCQAGCTNPYNWPCVLFTEPTLHLTLQASAWILGPCLRELAFSDFLTMGMGKAVEYDC